MIKDIIAWDLEGRLSRQSLFSYGARLSMNHNNENNIVVSITTIPSRVSRLHICIESILNQYSMPSRVILWLSKKYFPSLSNLPLPLRRQVDRGVEIYHCEKEWPHNKLLNSLMYCPDATIVTADDDMIYPPDWLSGLYGTHVKYPGTVVCHRSRIMAKNSCNNMMSYEKWLDYGELLVHPSHSNFPVGVGGILYPPQSLHEDVQNLHLAEYLCPWADDIWFKIMAFRNGTKCVAVSSKWVMPPEIQDSQNIALHIGNLKGGGNDKQLISVLQHYNIEIDAFFK